MEFHNDNHAYKVVPDVYGIKAEHDEYLALLKVYEKDPDTLDKPKEVVPVYLHLKGISQENQGDAVRAERLFGENHTREKSLDLTGENAIRIVADRVMKIENLTVDGKPVVSFMEIHQNSSLRAMADWIVVMVHSDERLKVHEIKN